MVELGEIVDFLTGFAATRLSDDEVHRADTQQHGPNRQSGDANEELEGSDVDPDDLVFLLLEGQEDKEHADEEDDASDNEVATRVLGFVVSRDVAVMGFAGEFLEFIANQRFLREGSTAKRAHVLPREVDSVAVVANAGGFVFFGHKRPFY